MSDDKKKFKYCGDGSVCKGEAACICKPPKPKRPDQFPS